MLRELLNRFRERKERMSQIDGEYRAQHTVEQRRKSADEREVEQFIAEQREAKIHEQAQQIRAQRQRQSWQGGKNILHEPNVFLNHHSVLTDNPKLSPVASRANSSRSMFWT